MNGLWKLTWIEIKVFMREPLGAFGTIVVPVLVFVIMGRIAGGAISSRAITAGSLVRVALPVFAAILIAISAVLSLVTIITIYREGGILKRLRATPLRPQTILTAHVVVKLLLTAATLVLLVVLGRRSYPIGSQVPLLSFGVAVLFATWSLLSIGFVIASIVPTARFAQPLTALVLYPMIAFSGLFFPIATLPPPMAAVVRWLPFAAAASFLNGVWRGDGWLAHGADVVALAVTFVVCMALSAKVFRWE